jgi:hypothetical protein
VVDREAVHSQVPPAGLDTEARAPGSQSSVGRAGVAAADRGRRREEQRTQRRHHRLEQLAISTRQVLGWLEASFGLVLVGHRQRGGAEQRPTPARTSMTSPCASDVVPYLRAWWLLRSLELRLRMLR